MTLHATASAPPTAPRRRLVTRPADERWREQLATLDARTRDATGGPWSQRMRGSAMVGATIGALAGSATDYVKEKWSDTFSRAPQALAAPAN